MTNPRSTAAHAATPYDLELEHAFRASPAAVFDGFIDLYGDERPDWIVSSDLDLRVGGRWRVTFHPPGLPPFDEERQITVLDPPRRLEYTMQAVVDGTARFRTTVALSLARRGDGTRLTFTQRGFPDAATRDEFAANWPGVFDQVAARLGV